MNPPKQKNRRNGKVARLPETLRDKINKMLENGCTYRHIIAELEKSTAPALPYSLTIDNISNWHGGGYQDFLSAKERAERLNARHDQYFAQANENPAEFTAGTLHAATVELCEVMDEAFLSNPGDRNPDQFCKMANSVARMSRLTLGVQQYRDLAAKLKTAAANS